MVGVTLCGHGGMPRRCLEFTVLVANA